MKRNIEIEAELSVESAKKAKISNEKEEDADTKKLVELIRFKKKLSMKKANVILSLNQETKINDESPILNDNPQFFVQDLQRVILFSLIGNQYRFYPRWCKILRPKYIKSVNLITINNLAELDYKKNENEFKKFKKLFINKNGELNSIEFVSSYANGSKFFDEFQSVPITRTQWLKIRDEAEFIEKRKKVVEEYKSLYMKSKSNKKTNQSTSSTNTSVLDKIPRTSLILSVAQLLREDYPLPFDTSDSHDMTDYVFTKSKYKKVTDHSPLYSIDCEMCYNVDGEMEIVWIAIVNEGLECVYESFVKPEKKIQNYLTHITGVSAKTLEEITTNLKEVQQKIIEILPSDAILCGQSLNNDLHALRMFHPYVIDTSVIYNISGNRDIKPSLRQLSAQFLGKLIQESTHNPSIDAKASLELILLKLRQGFDFGDVIINGCINIFDQENHNLINFDDLTGTEGMTDPLKISKFIYQTGLNIDQEFFNVLRDNDVSNVFIDSEKNIKSYKNKINKSCNTTDVSGNGDVFEKMCESINKYKFAWCQFECNQEESIGEIMKYVRKLNKKLDDDSLLMVAFIGKEKSDDKMPMGSKKDALKGRCFLKYKCEEMEKLEKQVKELYNRVGSKAGLEN